ncbi:MAG: DDE-type integrase/transposase/recombinase [Hydrogenophaga sp.]|uniref:reverse transcriptase domain-containing protein n=1 Tax=Hydrogenophaga sp. TaxID=1904254 RepID=UPI002631F330|nr:reverse transcriptase domain-containing protein [Hydrogenophaga sp.]MCW5672650.1 DDE-type integrase/transposase/recombinase [Hydrogenophaga sp.]
MANFGNEPIKIRTNRRIATAVRLEKADDSNSIQVGEFSCGQNSQEETSNSEQKEITDTENRIIATTTTTTTTVNAISSNPPKLPQIGNEFEDELNRILNRTDKALPATDRLQLAELLRQNSQLFCKSLRNPGKANFVPHEIDTGDAKPIRRSYYRSSPKEDTISKEHITAMLEANVIQPSTSPWSAPVVMVPKKGSTELRFCIDYRALNAVTRQDAYPMPRIEDTLDKLGKATIFSTLDLASGYWQIPIREEDKQKTAFSTKHGLFEFNVMPFGITNGPSTFQRNMDVILAGLTTICCLVYIDDIIVYSQDFKQHLKDLQKVFNRVKQANMFIKASKCNFCRTELPFLGHIVSKDGIKMDPEKVKVLTQLQTPRNVAELRRFLGLASYYRKFIHEFAHITAPLSKLTSSKNAWDWTAEQQQAFQTIIQKLSTAPILAYPDFEKPFSLSTDASNVAIGGVLSQLDDNGRERVIAYGSRILNDAERAYSTSKKESLAVVTFAKLWRPYLHGSKFTIHTDHSALSWLARSKDTNGMMARWALRMEEFQPFEIKYRPGKQNTNADFCSRPPVLNLPEIEREKMPSNKEKLATTTTKSEENNAVIAISNVSIVTEDKISSVIKQMAAAQREDDQLKPIVDFLEGKMDTSNKSEYGKVAAIAAQMEIFNGVLYHLWWPQNKRAPRDTTRRQIVVPKSMKQEILQLHHDSLLGGHFGRARTYERLRERFWWPTMIKDTYHWTDSCQKCQESKNRRESTIGKLKPFPASRLWERIAVDLITPLPRTPRGNSAILVFSEAFSKYKWAIPVPNLEATTIANAYIKEIVCKMGAPKYLLSDRGTQFLSDVLAQVNKYLGTTKLNTTSYHPQTDGEVERFNSTLQQQLKRHVDQSHENWDLYLDMITFAYNATPHPTTGDTPAFLALGRDICSPVERELEDDEMSNAAETVQQRRSDILGPIQLAHQIVAENLREQAAKMQTSYDKKVADIKFEPGELVMLFTPPKTEPGKSAKLSRCWSGPFRVLNPTTEKHNPLNAEIVNIRDPNNKQRVHINRLKKYIISDIYDPTDNSDVQPDHYEIEDILEKQVTSDGETKYLVKWKDFTKGHNIWVNESDLNAPEILNRFNLRQQQKPTVTLQSKDEQIATPPSRSNNKSKKATKPVVEETKTTAATTTRSGRVVRKPRSRD